MKRKVLILVAFIVGFSTNTFAQIDDESFWYRDRSDETEYEGIVEYDKYNPIVGGDSVRYCGKVPCNGWIKDYYEDGETLKHQGSYENGKLRSVYKNYYQNGQLERFFKISASGASSSVETYFENGNKHYKVVYRRMDIIEYEEYQENGKPEVLEKMDKKGVYHLYQKYFFPNGNIYSEMVLEDKEKKVYSYSTYFENGKKRSEGKRVHQKATGDYIKHHRWVYYNEAGEVVKRENYSFGVIVE